MNLTKKELCWFNPVVTGTGIKVQYNVTRAVVRLTTF